VSPCRIGALLPPQAAQRVLPNLSQETEPQVRVHATRVFPPTRLPAASTLNLFGAGLYAGSVANAIFFTNPIEMNWALDRIARPALAATQLPKYDAKARLQKRRADLTRIEPWFSMGATMHWEAVE
jgi:hypothetical protein